MAERETDNEKRLREINNKISALVGVSTQGTKYVQGGMFDSGRVADILRLLEAYNRITVEALYGPKGDLINVINIVNPPPGGPLPTLPRIEAKNVEYDPTLDPVTGFTNLQDVGVDHGKSIEQRVSSANGIIRGGLITQDSPTTFGVAAGDGEIHDSYTTPENTSIIEFAWPGLSGITIDVGGENISNTKIFMQSNGQILQVTGPVTFTQLREAIFLGVIYTREGQITTVQNSPSVVKQTGTDAYDSLVDDVSIKGSRIFPVDSVLSLWIEQGSLFFPGVNWYIDKTSPNLTTLIQVGDSLTPITFRMMFKDGTIEAGTFTVIPKLVNDGVGNSTSTLNGNNATIFRLYSLGFGVDREFILLYGQAEYNNAIIAKDNSLIDNNTTIFPGETDSMFLLGQVCISGNASNFGDISRAWIISGSLNEISSGGISTTDRFFDSDTVLLEADMNLKWIFVGTAPATLTLPPIDNYTLLSAFIVVLNISSEAALLHVITTGAGSTISGSASFSFAGADALTSTDGVFNFGDTDKSMSGWVRMRANDLTYTILSKWEGGTNDKSYTLQFDNSVNKLRIFFSNDGVNNSSPAVSNVVMALNTWYHWAIVYDSVNDLLKISVDNENLVSVAHAGGAFNSAALFRLGAAIDRTAQCDMDSVVYHDEALSQAKISDLYNGGVGRNWADQDQLNVIEQWPLNEPSGDRIGSKKAYPLTDFNTVVGSTGHVLYDVIDTIQDASGGVTGLTSVPLIFGQQRLFQWDSPNPYYEFILDWTINLVGDFVPDSNQQFIGDKNTGPNGVAFHRATEGVQGVLIAFDQSQPNWLPYLTLAGIAVPNVGDPLGSVANSPIVIWAVPVMLKSETPVLISFGESGVIPPGDIKNHYMVFGSVQDTSDGEQFASVNIGPKILFAKDEGSTSNADFDVSDAIATVVTHTATEEFGGTGSGEVTIQVGVHISEEGQRDGVFTIRVYLPGNILIYTHPDIILNNNNQFVSIAFSVDPSFLPIAALDIIEVRVEGVRLNPNAALWVRGTITPSSLDLREEFPEAAKAADVNANGAIPELSDAYRLELAGAYNMPLLAHLKNAGIKIIHIKNVSNGNAVINRSGSDVFFVSNAQQNATSVTIRKGKALRLMLVVDGVFDVV